MSDSFIDITLAEPAVRSAIFEYVKKYFNFDPDTVDVRNITLPDAQGREAIVRILPKPPEKKPEADPPGPGNLSLTLPLGIARQREVMRNLLNSFSGGAVSPEEQNEVFAGQEALWRVNERAMRSLIRNQDPEWRMSNTVLAAWAKREVDNADSGWFVFVYTNHRGEVERRAVIMPSLTWGFSKYHPGKPDGWHASAFDLRSWQCRAFRISDVVTWGFRPNYTVPYERFVALAREFYDAPETSAEIRQAIRLSTTTDKFSNLVMNK